MALMLAATLFVGSVVFSSATQGAGAANDIEVPIGSGVLPEERNHSLIDFNSNKIVYGRNGKTMNQTYINYYLDSESADEIWYMDTDLYVGENPVKTPSFSDDYQYMWDMFSSNGRYYAHREVASVGGKGAIDTCLQFRYDPATDRSEERTHWGESDLSVMTQKFVSEKVVSSSSIDYVQTSYDYVEVSFDLFFYNPQACFVFGLENRYATKAATGPSFYLMVIDTDGKVYLRESSGSSSMEVASYDKEIGQLNVGEWNSFTVTFYPQVGTVGYYNYWISMNGEQLTNEGTTTYMSSWIDNASFLHKDTLLKFAMGGTETEPTAATYWAIDNIDFQTYDYLNEPAEGEANLPEMETEYVQNLVAIPESAITGNVETVPGSGEYSLMSGDAVGAYLHLYKSALEGLTYHRVNNDFSLDFKVYGSTPFKMQFYGATFDGPTSLVADQWNEIHLVFTVSNQNIVATLNGVQIDAEFFFEDEPVFAILPQYQAPEAEPAEGAETEPVVIMQIKDIRLEETIYRLKTETKPADQLVWDSNGFNANDVINMTDEFTVINGNVALQFDKVSDEASALDPNYQVKGSYENGSFKLTIIDGGFIVKGQKVDLLLYRQNGNPYLSGSRVADNFTITFKVFGNPAISLKLYGEEIAVSGLAADVLNTVTVKVEALPDGMQDKVTVNGVEHTLTRAENPVFSILLPENEEVQIQSMSLVEHIEKEVYFIKIDGQFAELSDARVNYLVYQWEKRYTISTKRPFEYGTVDRRAVRPVGEVQFDTDTYYHKHGVTVAGWGSTVTPAVACDVNYWMSNKSSLDANGNETNSYLMGYADIYMENAAVVTQMYAQGKDGKTGLHHTSGVQFNFFRADGVKSMKQDYVTEYFRATLSFWYDSVTFPDAGAEYRLGAENSYGDHTSDTDTRGSRYMTGQVMFRVETTDAGPRLIIPTDRYGYAVEGDAGYRLTADDNYMLSQATPSTDANGNTLINQTHVFVTNPLSELAACQQTGNLSFELQEGWNTLELEFKKVHSSTANDLRGNADGSTTTFEMNHHIFEVRYAVNGDYLYHTPEDKAYGNLFYFDNGLDPSSQHVYMQITAPLYSNGTELPSELERTKYKSLKLEFLSDQEIDVNSYEKGTDADDVIRYTDFVTNMIEDALAKREAEDILAQAIAGGDLNDIRRAQKALDDLNAIITKRQLSVSLSAKGAVSLMDINDRLVVEHKADNSTAEIFYPFAAGEINDVMTYDFSYYCGEVYDGDTSSSPTKAVQSPKLEVFVGDTVLMTIKENGSVYVGGKPVAECKTSGWNNLSVVLEKYNGEFLLTAYVNGEIVSFRIASGVDAIANVGVRTIGNTGDGCRFDDFAVSTTNIPTGVVYMHPITYVLGNGQMAYDPGVGYHVVGSEQALLPSVGMDNALFGGWYFDPEFTSKATQIRASYTKPVILYAKYNYVVSYDLPQDLKDQGVNAPRDTIAYGNITLPQITGVVEYWHANVNGQDVYVKGGETYNVSSNVTFMAVSGEGKAKAEFVLSVLNISFEDRYEIILESVKTANSLYANLTDAEKAEVQSYRDYLDQDVANELNARLALAEQYLALFAILADKNATYADRLAAYEAMDVNPYNGNTEGKTFRDFVDMTIPGVFEANGDLATHSRTLERAKEACIQLVLAVEGYKNAAATGKLSSMQAKFNYASLVSKAYNTATAPAIRYAVETYLALSMADFEGIVLRDTYEDNMKVIPTALDGDINAYLAAAKDILTGYNTIVEQVNNDMLGAHQVADSFTTGVFSAAENRVPAAIVALLDRCKEELEALLEQFKNAVAD